MGLDVLYKYKTDLTDSELRSCVQVEVAVLGSPSLIVLMVSVDIKPQWTWTWLKFSVWICVSLTVHACVCNTNWPQCLIVSLQHDWCLCQDLGDANSANFSFRVTRHLLQVGQKQALHHHGEHPATRVTILLLVQGLDNTDQSAQRKLWRTPKKRKHMGIKVGWNPRVEATHASKLAVKCYLLLFLPLDMKTTQLNQKQTRVLVLHLVFYHLTVV